VRSTTQVGLLDHTKKKLQNRKENTVSLAWLSDFVLHRLAAVHSIAPLQSKIKIPETK
jgi:hypothetical protein